jgi:hypothetical protein
VSTTIDADSITLANTIIHELTHNTFFAKGRVPVQRVVRELRGRTRRRARLRARGDTSATRRATEDWQNDLVLGAFWERLAGEIDSVFAALPRDSVAARVAARDTVYARARRRLVDSVSPLLVGYPVGWGTRGHAQQRGAAVTARVRGGSGRIRLGVHGQWPGPAPRGAGDHRAGESEGEEIELTTEACRLTTGR